jgi:hypothetical protein
MTVCSILETQGWGKLSAILGGVGIHTYISSFEITMVRLKRTRPDLANLLLIIFSINIFSMAAWNIGKKSSFIIYVILAYTRNEISLP